jgi:hypothetical protein
MQQTATQRLFDKLPNVIRCTDDYTFGSTFLPKNLGIHKSYIQVNTDTYQHAIVLDHDQEGFMADLRYEHSHLPIPNIVIENKINGRAHSITLLNSPIPKTDNSHKHPIAYCESVEHALTFEYDADPFFNGDLVKSPFSKAYRIHQLRDKPYDLGELADKLDLKRYTAKELKAIIAKERSKVEGGSLGRNCYLFDVVRVWAYRAVREYRGTSLELWRSAVMQETMVQNAMLNQRLDFNEVKGIAKSIARYCWSKDGKAEARFKATQAHRGSLGDSSPGGKAKSAQYDDQRTKARTMYEQGMKKSQIAKELGVHRNSVNNWLK